MDLQEDFLKGRDFCGKKIIIIGTGISGIAAASVLTGMAMDI